MRCAATVMGFIVIFYSVYPLPAAPIGYAMLVALAWLVVGFGIAYYYVRRHPERMRKAGLWRE